jgi:hypothetical protein
MEESIEREHTDEPEEEVKLFGPRRGKLESPSEFQPEITENRTVLGAVRNFATTSLNSHRSFPIPHPVLHNSSLLNMSSDLCPVYAPFFSAMVSPLPPFCRDVLVTVIIS